MFAHLKLYPGHKLQVRGGKVIRFYCTSEISLRVIKRNIVSVLKKDMIYLQLSNSELIILIFAQQSGKNQTLGYTAGAIIAKPS